jgi:hypothetical protein
VLAAAAALSAIASARQPARGQPPAGAPAGDEAMARQVCGACHAFPPPDVRPRALWKTTVAEMTALTIAGIGVPPGAPPPPIDFDPERIARFYESRAPDALPALAPWPAPGRDPERFARHGFRPAGERPPPAVANVRFFDLDGRGRPQVVAVDMHAGLVLAADPARRDGAVRELARIPHPCHSEAVDLDRDGLMDLVVADLGDPSPGDLLKGSVVWLRRRKDGGYDPTTLAAGLPRTADAQPADVDGDGDLDLVVAAFGWREAGGIFLLENRTESWAKPVFVKREVDPRPGAIHVPVTDLDGDGKPDFVALLAQHHEAVVAFLGDGKGSFRPHPLYTAPHPVWGSSGLALHDMDGDRDLDVLVTNGDMLDDFLLKPFHGIRWLENRGGLSFREHALASLGGVHRALATDLDRDGDLDVVAVAFVMFQSPDGTVLDPRASEEARLASLVWLEQVAPGRFERHTLEQGGRHTSLDVADYDRDGDPDLVVGHLRTPGAPWIEVWENLTRR